MKSRTFGCLILLACTWLGISCRQAETPKPARTENTNAAAIVADTVISADMLKAELKRKWRRAPEGGLTADQKLAALETLVRHEAIYAKAKASGFEQDPEIQARIKNLVIAQFKEQLLKPTNAPVDEREFEAFYQSNGERFAQPDAVRGAVIFFSVPKGMTAEKKAELQQRAEAVLSEVRAADEKTFVQVVARHSEDQASRYRGGDLGWMSRGGADPDPAVMEALFALSQPGEFAPLVQGARGFFVAKLLEKRDAGRKPLGEVKEAIRYQISRQKAEQAERDFYAEMKSGLDIQINHALLDSISLPTENNEPPRMPTGATAKLP